MRPLLDPRRPIGAALAAALLLGASLFGVSPLASANEAVIRKAILERMPRLAIDDIQRTPIEGIWEVRYGGSEILYSDAKGEYLLVGASLIEMRTRVNLTEERLSQLLAVAWSDLPLADSIVYRQGQPLRRIAVFSDPMCGFCRQFETDLAAMKDTTIHLFPIAMLGAQSKALARDIWCARDPAAAWRGWMLQQVPPPKAAAGCNAQAMERNSAFGRTHKIDATPTSLFENGNRRSGALRPAEIERAFAAAPRKPS